MCKLIENQHLSMRTYYYEKKWESVQAVNVHGTHTYHNITCQVMQIYNSTLPENHKYNYNK